MGLSGAAAHTLQASPRRKLAERNRLARDQLSFHKSLDRAIWRAADDIEQVVAVAPTNRRAGSRLIARNQFGPVYLVENTGAVRGRPEVAWRNRVRAASLRWPRLLRSATCLAISKRRTVGARAGREMQMQTGRFRCRLVRHSEQVERKRAPWFQSALLKSAPGRRANGFGSQIGGSGGRLCAREAGSGSF